MQAVSIDGNAEWCADGILSAITLADGVLGFDVRVEVEFQLIDDFLRLLGKSVLIYQGEHSTLYRSQRLGQFQHDTRASIL